MNQKGGVGKTTVTVNLGAALAKKGKKVLLLDLDPQANLSIHLNVNIHEIERSIYNVLISEISLEEAIIQHDQPRLSLIPANIDLSGAEVELVNAVGRETLLRDALDLYLEKNPCDYILFDCPPSLGILSLNALGAAQEVFIPIQTEFFALQGLAKLMSVIQLITKRLNSALHLGRVIPTMYDTRTSLSKEVLSDIKDHFGEAVTDTIIRKNVKLAESPSHGKTIFEYAPASSGAIDFSALGDEILGRPKKKIKKKKRPSAKPAAKKRAAAKSEPQPSAPAEPPAPIAPAADQTTDPIQPDQSLEPTQVDQTSEPTQPIEAKVAQALASLNQQVRKRCKATLLTASPKRNGFLQPSRNSLRRMRRVRFIKGRSKTMV